MGNNYTLDILFVSEQPLWPVDRGSRVRGANLARTLAQHGLKVGLATLQPAESKTPGWMQELTLDWPRPMPSDLKRFALGWSGKLMGLRDRLAGAQGLNANQVAGILPLVEQSRPRAVVAIGKHGPALLRGLAWAYPTLPRVWVADQEPASAELSQLKREGITALGRRGKGAMQHALMLACFNGGNAAHRTSAIVGNSPSETRWLSRLGGTRATTIVNGVDTDYYHPTDAVRSPRTAIMFGNLGSEATAQAACWFAKKVWPHAVYRWPDATWTILGRSPRPEVRALADQPGVELVMDVKDIRPHVRSHAAVVVPTRCGRGTSNALLESASMGMPILASSRAKRGLDLGSQPAPMLTCHGAATWVEALDKVWHAPARARALGGLARAWVQERHSWDAAAIQMNTLLQGLQPTEEVFPEAQTEHAPATTLRIAQRHAA